MKIVVRNKVDLEAGIFFLIIGLVVVGLSTHYALGTALNMGPGYFPLALGLVLSVLGIAILVRAILAKQDQEVVGFHFRQVGVVTIAICLFAVTLMSLGLLIAVPVLVIVSLAAAPDYRWKDVLILAAALTLISYLIFHVGLNLGFPLLGGIA